MNQGITCVGCVIVRVLFSFVMLFFMFFVPIIMFTCSILFDGVIGRATLRFESYIRPSDALSYVLYIYTCLPWFFFERRKLICVIRRVCCILCASSCRRGRSPVGGYSYAIYQCFCDLLFLRVGTIPVASVHSSVAYKSHHVHEGWGPGGRRRRVMRLCSPRISCVCVLFLGSVL